MKKEYILFIDSGTGGLSTLSEVYKRISANFIYYADNKNCPYGSHSRKEILGFLKNILDEMFNKYEIFMVVLACNTATTSSIDKLRKLYPDKIFIGTEPAIKLANSLGYKKILVLSTPATAKQKKYRQLRSKLQTRIQNLCIVDFAENIELWLTERASRNNFEQNKSTKTLSKTASICHMKGLPKVSCGQNLGTDFCSAELGTENFQLEFSSNILSRTKLIKNLYQIKSKSKNFDCIVLGCTHYLLIEELIRGFASKPLISGNFGVAKQIEKFLNSNHPPDSKNLITFKFSKHLKGIEENYKKIFMQILANQ